MPSLIEDYGPLLDNLYFPNNGELAKGTHCQAAKFHAPRPLVVRRVSLTPWGEGKALESVVVCGLCADLLCAYQQFLAHFNGNVPYDLANRFAPSLRRLALRGWQLYRSEPS